MVLERPSFSFADKIAAMRFVAAEKCIYIWTQARLCIGRLIACLNYRIDSMWQRRARLDVFSQRWKANESRWNIITHLILSNAVPISIRVMLLFDVLKERLYFLNFGKP